MYWFARMYSLRILNLPNNHIVQIEGLRELQHLIHLNLAGNNIKNIEGLSYSYKLEHLNLSGNMIAHIGDMSVMKNLKELFLHRNRITNLHRCNKYMPTSLLILTLSDNTISDLNELCSLSHLTNLEQFTILNNPCLQPLQLVDESGMSTGAPLGFDYRPYVINWCLNLKVLDGYKVTPKESLKAEWLYSQGKGRGFQVGEHTSLVQYLSGVCLAGGGWGGADLPDDDDKLAKILQLAKQHQQELRHSTVNGHDNSDSSSGCGSRGSSHHDSPASHRRALSRNSSLRRSTGPQRPSKSVRDHRRTNSHTPGAPAATPSIPRSGDTISHSYHVELSSTLYGGDLKTPDTPSLMTRSMDPALLAQLSEPPQPTAVDRCCAVTSINQMSRSLGPEQMMRSLDVDHVLSYSLSNTMDSQSLTSHKVDLMSQSLCPEQLHHSLQLSGHENHWDKITSGDYLQRPTKLFGEDTDSTSFDADSLEGSHLDGSSQFVPAPESMMSPEFQMNDTPKISSVSRTAGIPKNSKSAKPPPAVRPSSSPQIPPRQSGMRSTSLQRPRTTPVKSPAPTDVTRGSPSRSQKYCSGGSSNSTSAAREQQAALSKAKQSPKPAPRYSRSSSVSQTPILQKKDDPRSPGRGLSEGESDNTDSEMSISKLQTIKSIAAERKGRERKSSTVTSMKATEETSSKRSYSPGSSSHHQHSSHPTKSSTVTTFNSERYRSSPRLRHDSRGRKSSNSSGGSHGSRSCSQSRITKMNETEAAVTLQKHWRGFRTRFKNPAIAKIRNNIRHLRSEQHIKYLADKLKAAETALDRERKLRHLQLDAIRTLWREVQKLQTGRKEGVNTPSTPMTPLTPLTPLERAEKIAAGAAVPASTKGNVYSEESVNELTDFCNSLQTQVSQLQDSLSMVTQVMNAFCNLPGSQSLLTMSQSSGSGMEKSLGEDDFVSQGGNANVPLSESVAKFTTSIRALTTSIVKSPTSASLVETLNRNTSEIPDIISKDVKNKVDEGACQTHRPGLHASATSLTSNELNSTGNDVSTISNDESSGLRQDGNQDGEFSEDSSQSSLSASISGSPSLGVANGPGSGPSGSSSNISRIVGPQRPSSLPVARPHTPRTNS